MGQTQSLGIPPNHIEIYRKISAIQNPATKLQMIQVVLEDASVIQSAKRAGVYANLLATAAAIRHGTPAPAPKTSPSYPQQLQHPPQQPLQPQQYQQHQQYQQPQQQQLTTHTGQLAYKQQAQEDPYGYVAKSKRNEKALNYFTTCLRVLGIEEEVALTEDFLRKAYKKAAIKAHPDKGGSDKAMDAVTRAYAYLGDILRMTQGSKKPTDGPVTAGDVESARSARSAMDAEVSYPAPVRLDPKNLNMQAFNQMFEQTRVPDPDEDGYGDWLKGGGGVAEPQKKFSGDFNREVFNRVFEEDSRGRNQSQDLTLFNPNELTLAPTYGVELGRDRPADYTAATGADFQYTDLRSAYETENTIQDKIAGIKVAERNYESYKAQREAGPAMYNPSEQEALKRFQAKKEAEETQRRQRAAQEQHAAQEYFNRMKQLVITNGTPIPEKKNLLMR